VIGDRDHRVTSFLVGVHGQRGRSMGALPGAVAGCGLAFSPP
jgi:hypothetical protein